MFNKLKEIQNYLNCKFFERTDEIEGLLVALLSRQHMLLIGPAGTAKSALSMELSKIITGTNYFQWLLSQFSTPEELFGALSLKELERGVYKRNTAQKLPESHIAFIDEIFKANSAILNSLLTIINERLFYNNGTPIQTPLMTIVGASNEYPEEGEGLEALFDRFLLRFEVDYIKEEQNFISMLKGAGQNEPAPSMTLEELIDLQFQCEMILIPDEVFHTLALIRQELRDEGIRPSDRRFKQSLKLLQAKAMLEQRNEVKISDILVLRSALWETIDQKPKVVEIVEKYSKDVLETRLNEIRQEVADIVAEMANEEGDSMYTLEATKKVKLLKGEIQTLIKDNPERLDDITPVADLIDSTLDSIASKMIEL